MTSRQVAFIAIFGIALTVLIIGSVRENLRNGGWYGADGVWHTVGGPPR